MPKLNIPQDHALNTYVQHTATSKSNLTPPDSLLLIKLRVTSLSALIVIAFFLPSIRAYGQRLGTDSKGKPVFTHYAPKILNLESSENEPLGVSYLWGRQTIPYVLVPTTANVSDATLQQLINEASESTVTCAEVPGIVAKYLTGSGLSAATIVAIENDLRKTGGSNIASLKKIIDDSEETTTITKMFGFFIRGAIRTADRVTTISDISKFHPGAGLRLGFQFTIPKFNAIDRMPANYHSAYSIGANLILDVDNLNLYDPKTSATSRVYPATYGIEGNINLYFRKRKTTGPRIFTTFIASATKTYNDDQLLSFKELGQLTSHGNVVAFKDFDGKYGTLNTDVSRLRLASSLPIFWGKFNPIPFAVVNVTNTSAPRYLAGCIFNAMSKALPINDFTIPAVIGFGVNQVMQGSTPAKTEVYIKGSLSF